jgi:hypothetical protein
VNATEVQRVEAQVVGRLSEPPAGSTLALGQERQGDKLMQFLRDMGFPVPIASPEELRAAFDYQTRMFAAVLGENDYLYVVTYKDVNKMRSDVTTSYADAVKMTERFAPMGAQMSAKPKKSGIVKLARALGITGRVLRRAGLPDDPMCTFAFVEYEALHEATGRSEVGVGWCDLSERGGKISKHDAIATADTRAYNRAVLRLAGFGDVSAEEIVAGPIGPDEPGAGPATTSVPETSKFRKPAAVPGESTDVVLAACAAWAQAAASRAGERFLPAAAQETREAREMRAKARRGDQEVATRMGAQGIDWTGTAIDGNGFEPWAVGAPPVTVEQVVLSREMASEAKTAVAQRARGWDLSSEGSGADDRGLITEAPRVAATPPAAFVAGSAAPADIPAPDPRSDVITSAQAKKVSAALKSLCSGDVQQVRAWLREQCKVGSTMELRSNQYDTLMRHLDGAGKREE